MTSTWNISLIFLVTLSVLSVSQAVDDSYSSCTAWIDDAGSYFSTWVRSDTLRRDVLGGQQRTAIEGVREQTHLELG
jgi:hypothetical protein